MSKRKKTVQAKKGKTVTSGLIPEMLGTEHSFAPPHRYLDHNKVKEQIQRCKAKRHQARLQRRALIKAAKQSGVEVCNG